MRTVRRIVVGSGVGLMVVALTACAQVPQQAIDEARAALVAATDAEAPTYAEVEWAAAQEALNEANAEVEAQNAKFVLLRSYDDAGKLLVTATERAELAAQAAVEGKERLRAEVEQNLSAVEGQLASARQLLDELAACRKRPKGFAGDLELMRGNVEALALQMGEVRSSLLADSLIEADTMAKELVTEVDAAVVDLENVKAKLGC